MSPLWQEVDHTADWALKVRGADLRSLFENAALGMVSLIGGEVAPQGAIIGREFALHAPDIEILLVDWLTELLWLVEDESAVVSEIAVLEVSDLTLQARVAAKQGGEFSKHIKAVTYHNLAIRQVPGGFETMIVFDV